MDYAKESLRLHQAWKGKIQVNATVPVATREDLSLAYTPGVAQPCLEIQKDPSLSYTLTRRWNLCLVVSDGTAVLGLGDIGPEASMPVMEGKCVLFKSFGDVDAFPMCIKSKDVDEIVNTVYMISGSCGGVNLDFQVGDLMVIDDHINFMGANPLTGPNDAGFGPRFCDMTYAYTPALRRLADEVAAAQGVALRHGVYLGYMGPSYETPAEIRAFRVLGADAVGMSTVPEVIAASHCGLPVLAISLVTNMAAGVLEKKLDENEVIETAAARAKVLERLVTGIVERL